MRQANDQFVQAALHQCALAEELRSEPDQRPEGYIEEPRLPAQETPTRERSRADADDAIVTVAADEDLPSQLPTALPMPIGYTLSGLPSPRSRSGSGGYKGAV